MPAPNAGSGSTEKRAQLRIHGNKERKNISAGVTVLQKQIDKSNVQPNPKTISMASFSLLDM
jgi:hypothetical protein